MTKKQEIDLLDKFIQRLGPQSYIGPWLASVKLQIVSNIRNDFPADMSIINNGHYNYDHPTWDR